jgi:protein phosphatase
MVWKMTRRESGYLAVLGNHDWKIYRALVQERDVKISNGLDRSIREFYALTRPEQAEIKQILDDLFSKAPASTALAATPALEEKRLVLTHGALRPEDLGKRPAASRRDPLSARSLYGEVSGMDEEGRPIRAYEWVKEWDNYPNTTLIFGHDVQGWEPVWLSGQVLGLDTGCCFGGRLSAYRYPEGDILQVDSLMGKIAHERLLE